VQLACEKSEVTLCSQQLIGTVSGNYADELCIAIIFSTSVEEAHVYFYMAFRWRIYTDALLLL